MAYQMTEKLSQLVNDYTGSQVDHDYTQMYQSMYDKCDEDEKLMLDDFVETVYVEIKARDSGVHFGPGSIKELAMKTLIFLTLQSKREKKDMIVEVRLQEKALNERIAKTVVYHGKD